jgi:hypothetical protein
VGGPPKYRRFRKKMMTGGGTGFALLNPAFLNRFLRERQRKPTRDSQMTPQGSVSTAALSWSSVDHRHQ